MSIIGTYMVPHPPLIVHEVGRGEENEISETRAAYMKVAQKIAALKPETIIITSPHATMYSDYFHISSGISADGDLGQFGADQVRFHAEYDVPLIEAVCTEADKAGLAAGTNGQKEPKLDHATMVPLYFINQFIQNEYKLVRIGLSGQSYKKHYLLGECIQRAVEKTGRRVVIVASGDLSHVLKADGPYGFRSEGPVYDERIMNVMGTGKFGGLFLFDPEFCEKAAECGHRSFIIMAGALDRTAVKVEKLSYEGPFGVGYGICVYTPEGCDERRNFLEQYEVQEKKKVAERKRNEDEFVALARATVEIYVRTRKVPKVAGGCVICDDDDFHGWHLSPELLSRRAGTFVSLKEDGSLRGCIGTISPTCGSLAEEIIHNAISASTQDPRFPEVEAEELSSIVYSVDVLGLTEKISSPKELDVKKYGVVVTKGYRRGLLLPALDSVDTVDEQINIACRKGGIDRSENPDLERFEVVRHY
ncbi:MAG: AmmeMemoRadiSam system protein A [Treponema sp.]|nr:AmmeMemoRadiSam system protein A [Treponema sp.]